MSHFPRLVVSGFKHKKNHSDLWGRWSHFDLRIFFRLKLNHQPGRLAIKPMHLMEPGGNGPRKAPRIEEMKHTISRREKHRVASLNVLIVLWRIIQKQHNELSRIQVCLLVSWHPWCFYMFFLSFGCWSAPFWRELQLQQLGHLHQRQLQRDAFFPELLGNI